MGVSFSSTNGNRTSRDLQRELVFGDGFQRKTVLHRIAPCSWIDRETGCHKKMGMGATHGKISPPKIWGIAHQKTMKNRVFHPILRGRFVNRSHLLVHFRKGTPMMAGSITLGSNTNPCSLDLQQFVDKHSPTFEYSWWSIMRNHNLPH